MRGRCLLKLLLSTHIPDRVASVISISGYSNHELHGDANMLFDFDMQLSYMNQKKYTAHMRVLFVRVSARVVKREIRS